MKPALSLAAAAAVAALLFFSAPTAADYCVKADQDANVSNLAAFRGDHRAQPPSYILPDEQRRYWCGAGGLVAQHLTLHSDSQLPRANSVEGLRYAPRPASAPEARGACRQAT